MERFEEKRVRGTDSSYMNSPAEMKKNGKI